MTIQHYTEVFLGIPVDKLEVGIICQQSEFSIFQKIGNSLAPTKITIPLSFRIYKTKWTYKYFYHTHIDTSLTNVLTSVFFSLAIKCKLSKSGRRYLENDNIYRHGIFLIFFSVTENKYFNFQSCSNVDLSPFWDHSK